MLIADAKDSFSSLKVKMIKVPILFALDNNKNLFVCAIATKHSLGAVLMQRDEEKEMVSI